jgi:hypothetical protein
MPVTLSARAIGDALARLQEHEIDAESALSWLGWDREAPLRIRRYDLQLYLWYQLPTKYLAPLEAKRDVAAALASLLELAGADAYAALCRAPDVDHMLGLWEDDDPAAPRRLDELLDASGLEPPDTELLTWGPVMGLVEADVRDRAAEVLELALEAGELVPARRSQLVAAVLAEPVDGGTRRATRELARAPESGADRHRRPRSREPDDAEPDRGRRRRRARVLAARAR